jgi:peptidyl-tRNA hydrolase
MQLYQPYRTESQQKFYHQKREDSIEVWHEQTQNKISVVIIHPKELHTFEKVDAINPTSAS